MRICCCPCHYAAGTEALFNINISNAGNVHLRAVKLDLPAAMAGKLTCDKALPADVPVKSQVHCAGTFVFTLDDIEAGSYSLNASVSATNLAALVAAAPVAITAVPVPQLEIDVLGSNCTKPPRARKKFIWAAGLCQWFPL
jgi:hypothetical protein